MPTVNMKMMALSPPSNRSVEKLLQEAEASGKLQLVNRRLKEIGQLIIKYDLTDLMHLDLSRNRFYEIPDEVFDWKCLDTLLLSNNSIKAISEAICELKLLETLNISNNFLTALPTQMCELQKLTIIKLSCNKLISLPDEIGRLKNCQELDVSENELTSIPTQLSDMSSLVYLSIRNNNIFEIPNEMSKMQLTYFDAGCNLITTIPVGFRNMTSLCTLILDHNPLTSPQLTILRKGQIHLFRELKIQAEKAQIRKEVMDDPLMSPMKRNNGRTDISFIEMKARAISISEISEVAEEKSLEKAADLAKDRRKGSVTSQTSPQKKKTSPVKRVMKKPAQKQKSSENIPATPPQSAKPTKTTPKGTITKERKRSASSGNFERKSSTEALLIHQKLSGFPGYKPHLTNDKSDANTANGKTPGTDHTKDRLQEFVKNRQALSPTDRNNQVSVTNNNKSSTNTKKGFLPSSIKPRSALNRLRGSSFTNSDNKDVSFTMRRKTEKLYEELELMESLRQNIEARLKITLGDEIPAALSDGVVLCHLTNYVKPRSVSSILVPSPAVPKLNLAKRRRNIDNFLDACNKIGVPAINICSTQDILLEKNIGKVALTVNELLKHSPNPAPSPKRQVETPTVKVAPSQLQKQQSIV